MEKHNKIATGSTKPTISIFISVFLLQSQGTQILPFQHRLVKDHEAACHSTVCRGNSRIAITKTIQCFIRLIN